MNVHSRPCGRTEAAPAESLSVLSPVQAPWLRPGVVVHEARTPVDGLLAEFALRLRDRGFNVTGYVQRNNAAGAEMGLGCAARIEFFDVASGQVLAATRAEAEFHLRKAMREDADLLVISRFQAFHSASANVNAAIAAGPAQGMPVLTSIAGRCVQKLGLDGAMIAPDPAALWRWWGPERLYQDLALGVAEDEVRTVAVGGRWIMVDGPHGSGVAYLPRSARDLLPRLEVLRRHSLRKLAGLVRSWDPAEMALGIAAINAHYNRRDRDLSAGNGARALSGAAGRVVVIGAFPGLADILPNSAVIETDPRPGEFPPVAMDTLLPGCGGAVVNSSALINRSLPRILRLAQGAPMALIGPSTPLTERLHDYGIGILGGLVVDNPVGLAATIRAGGGPREFTRFGRYVHLRRRK
ncbi:Rossmann-like domain-containing protein [Magnetospirillum aberrantis]|uniref:Rossmann-like domain-containing protein n=1 Tax=Magnetospirillum aberrantis TaxID=1105283 RepID=UPI00197B51CB|nr:DUF364 domain-containing protein [Magnetospirillum aberrantis]